MPLSPLVRLAALLTLMLSHPAKTGAEPALGFGFSFAVGQSGAVETGFGLRLLSHDRHKAIAATVGIDYVIGKKTFRPTVGLARVGSGGFAGLDISLGARPKLSVSGGLLGTDVSTLRFGSNNRR